MDRMTTAYCRSRDRQMWILYTQDNRMSAQEIAKKYEMSLSRVRQLLRDEKYKAMVRNGEITRISSLADRLEALYSERFITNAKQNCSVRSVFLLTLKYYPAKNPTEWVRWLKQATYDELQDINRIGRKKLRMLCFIQRDILKNRNERERQLILGTERMV